MAHTTVKRVQNQEVVLNNVPMLVNGDVTFELVNNYGRKIQQGDPGPNDHSVDSNIAQSEWTGGIGDMKYRGDESRSNAWWTTLYVQVRDSLSLNHKTTRHTVTGEEGNFAYLHGKIGGQQVATFGKKIKVWVESTQSFTDPGAGAKATTATPNNGGVTWGSDVVTKKVYIPCGSTYETFDGSTVAGGVASEKADSFLVWESKLLKLDSDGQVKATVDNTSWAKKGYIPEEFTPRNMFVFYDRSDNEVPHVSTSGAVYAVDYANGLLVNSDFEFPDHPYQGYGVARWRADAYVSVGLGVHRNNGGFITAVGPDGRDGLPEEYSNGYITSMSGSYNFLLALVKGGSIAVVPPAETADAGISIPERMISTVTGVYSTLLGYNGLGWSPMWTGEEEPTNVKVSSHEGKYRAFWGSRGAVFTQLMPHAYYNPLYDQSDFPLERYGEHITPYYNWGFVDTPKILKLLELKTARCNELDYIKVWMRIDDEEEWGNGESPGTPLAVITTNGQHSLETGFEDIADRRYHVGLTHERVQFRFELFGDPASNYSTPVIQWFNLVGRKWQRALMVLTFQVDATIAHKKRSPRKISDAIFYAARKKGGVPLVIGEETFIVDVTTNAGSMEAGMTYKAFHNVHCIQMTEDENDELDE